MTTFTKSIIPLPTTSQELSALRDIKTVRTLNDAVEDIMVVLWNEDDFRVWLEAVHDEDAREGSLAIDNAKAAELVRQKATDLGQTEVSGKKLATIVKAMNVVLRRYHRSRSERRNMVHGESVAPTNGD